MARSATVAGLTFGLLTLGTPAQAKHPDPDPHMPTRHGASTLTQRTHASWSLVQIGYAAKLAAIPA